MRPRPIGVDLLTTQASSTPQSLYQRLYLYLKQGHYEGLTNWLTGELSLLNICHVGIAWPLILLNFITSNFPPRAMSATPIPQEKRKQIVKVIFISLLLDLVSMAVLYRSFLYPCSQFSV